jgi:hypothetical protein
MVLSLVEKLDIPVLSIRLYGEVEEREVKVREGV